VLERPAGTAKLLARAGVPNGKIVLLRPDRSSAIGSDKVGTLSNAGS
jgi:hypothetical protein